MIEEKQTRLVQLGKELDDQRAKLERVVKQNAKHSRELRQAAKAKHELPEEVRPLDTNQFSLHVCVISQPYVMFVHTFALYMATNNRVVVMTFTFKYMYRLLNFIPQIDVSV